MDGVCYYVIGDLNKALRVCFNINNVIEYCRDNFKLEEISDIRVDCFDHMGEYIKSIEVYG